jgi:nitronate monooxygenase
MKTNAFCQKHGLTLPVVQAPMAGGPTTPELVAAVCNGGGLGSLGAAYLSSEQIGAAVSRLRELTDRPINVNLFAPDAEEAFAGDLAPVKAFLSRYHQRLGIPEPELPPHPAVKFAEQIDALLDCAVPIVSFTMGILPSSAIQRLKQRSVYLIGTATTVQEARLLEEAGVDAIVAQGSEAGGHRGTFATAAESALIGTMALVPQVVDAVSVPVIASGGVMDGRGIVASLALGASAVQMGTAFLCCSEAGTGNAYRSALLDAQEDETAVTRAFSGRLARGVRNEFMAEWESAHMQHLSYPWQNALTREMRRAAARAEDAGLQSLWAGQGLRLLRRSSAPELMDTLRKEIRETLAMLSAS